MLTLASRVPCKRRAIVSFMMSNRFPGLAVGDLPADVPAILEVLADTQPAIDLALIRALDETGTPAQRATANRLLETLANDLRLDQDVDAVASRACAAQETFENWTDERIDGLLLDVAKAFADSAKEFAVATRAFARSGRGAVLALRP
jgi:hypothetical protein